MAYSMDQDPDIGDASTGRIFAGKFKRHADLNELLASTKDRDKLEAMRRIIESVSSGKDVSQLFASVVKNVVSKNPEIKKLVYVYLVRYAEEQQDLALLSISTFQKALKDPNQLIRASALRVLSSIRVSIIVPIMMLAIKEAVTDMSPFVRKTACHAIPKLYNLDPELKEPLVEVIERLLKDKTTLVSGSAVMAFEELCPDRIDLIHKNYRKLCNLLVDIDEWGQTAVIHMLTRYARSQFVDPNKEEPENEQFYPSSQESEDDEEDKNDESDRKKPYIMDPDHRLILRVTKPLLQSRNSAVVMAVARLYHHCAPACEVGVVTRALVRLLKGHREVQYVVLSNIATLSSTRKGMFEAHLKSFFVHSNDSKYIKTFKLEIMTNIASESNITLLLREFQNYINNSDKEFVASTIQAIGRCASNIPEVTDTCLTGLVRLLSNRNETVVAESVVMIKKLLQLKHKDKSQIIIQMTKILNKITVPMARASIIWLVGEYAERVPKVAPDVLRIAAKSFTKEEDIVKLQIINLGAKLILINPNQTQQLCQYVLNLAKYDQSYDIRDRARFLRPIVFPGEKVGQIVKHSKKILLASKPPPVLESSFKGHGEFIVGSLSHLINARASGYQELPEYPEVPPDPSVRNVEVEPLWEKSKSKSRSKKKSTFYSSESESDSASESESGSGSSGSSGSESESDEGSESVSKSSMESLPGSETESQESDDEGERNERAKSRKKSESQSSIESKTSEESSDSDAESSESDSSQESDNAKQETPAKKVETKKSDDAPKNKRVSKPPTTDQLLSFDEDIPVAPVVNGPAHKNILSPSLVDDMKTLSLGVVQNGVTAVVQNVVTDFSQLRTYELLNKMAGRGLQAQYKFPRSPCLYSTTMVAVEVTFTNSGSSCVENIHVGEKKVGLGLKIADFPKIESIDIGSTVTVSMGIDFKDTIQPVSFEICTNSDKFTVKLKCPMGEQLHARPITENDFLSLQKKLSGMNESSLTVDIPQENCEERVLASKILGCASVAALPKNSSLNYYRFSGSAISSGVPVLITVELKDFGKASRITVNCEKMTINSILAKELVAAVGKV